MKNYTVKFIQQKQRVDSEDSSFCGYASVYDVVDEHNDVIVRGAFFDASDAISAVKLLWQHDHRAPIGTLNLIEEKKEGLYVEGKILTSTVSGKDAYVMLQEGVIDGLSIGFEVNEYFIEDSIRYITKAKLWEVSLVTFPANVHARASIVSCKKSRDYTSVIKEIERAINILRR